MDPKWQIDMGLIDGRFPTEWNPATPIADLRMQDDKETRMKGYKTEGAKLAEEMASMMANFKLDRAQGAIGPSKYLRGEFLIEDFAITGLFAQFLDGLGVDLVRIELVTTVLLELRVQRTERLLQLGDGH